MSTGKYTKYHMCNFNNATKPEDLPDVDLQRLWSCEFSKEHLDEIINNWLANSAATTESEPALLCDAIEMILIFLQNNFTGPFTNLAELQDMLKQKPQERLNPFEKLMENGEEVNPNVKLGELLVIAKEIIAKLLQETVEDNLVLLWWHMRLICIQQQIIDELTSNLYEQFKSDVEKLLSQQLEDIELETLLHLEIANGFLIFHRSEKSANVLEKICTRLNVELEVEGLLGVRTKFQQKALPQLCLKVTQPKATKLPAAASTHGSTKLPKLLLLDDDTRLERIRFVELKDNEVMTLPSVLQALVLAKVKQLKRSQPKDRLADEELEPYIQTLIYQEHGPLQVRQSVLLLNCVQECNHRRTVERSWKQCEEAVKLLDGVSYTLVERLSYAFAAFLQPKWQVQAQLCELLLSLGMTKTALDIYLQIQAWEDVIACYTRLELRQKAAEIIQQELQKQPTVLLHCLLGDATDDVNCYETAWKFSKETSGRAQAHWGNFYFRRHEYALAVPHFEKSVEINSLQEKIWARLGYAAIMLERWDLAVTAYITYTHLEPFGFESWNNLAKALIKLGDLKRAHKVLGESLKCNHQNWKVWANYMLVSMDTGNFEDVLNAYNRLCELRERFIDLEVLTLVVRAIVEDMPDAKAQGAGRLRKKASTLLAHQCVKYGNNSTLWELSAQLDLEPLNKAQKLAKACLYEMRGDWSTQQSTSKKTLELARDGCQYALEAVEKHAADVSELTVTSQLNTARLNTQSVINAVRKENQKWQENEELLKELEELQEKVIAAWKARSVKS